MNMSVSEMVRKDGKQHIYVLFTEGVKSAEGVLPEGEIICNSGFTEEEVSKLRDYLRGNVELIKGMAKKVNVMDAFLGKKTT
ncbi:MAG: hypothetical protein K6G23_10660 [Lachnospiraceae bacterium]|nr:hypothetical protein [Lachnospiraceae bacterium]